MEKISIPKNLDEWNQEKLLEIMKYPGIESETLDFKKEPYELQKHFCAMANTTGGFLILGIEEINSEDRTKLLGYNVKPFQKGKEESINQQIRNAISSLEPTPNMEFDHMSIENGFVTIIEFQNEISRKPFMIKETTQFWVRIKDSTQLANRSTIQMLFSASINQRNSIERLKSATSLLNESLLHTLNDIQAGMPYIPEVELDIFKNVVTDSEWFLTENKLWGKHTIQGGYEVGINSILHDLAFLNAKINGMNTASGQIRKGLGINLKNSYNRGGGYYESISVFLDRVITMANNFLKDSR